MLIIDSAKETKIGVGLNSWPPTLLKRGEVMIPQSVAKYLQKGIGDDVSIYIDFGKSAEMSKVRSPKAHIFALLAADIENVTVDFDRGLIALNGLGIPFDMLGLNSDPIYNATYTIKNTYETSSGKFSEAYGNVALIDCQYILH